MRRLFVAAMLLLCVSVMGANAAGPVLDMYNQPLLKDVGRNQDVVDYIKSEVIRRRRGRDDYQAGAGQKSCSLLALRRGRRGGDRRGSGCLSETEGIDNNKKAHGFTVRFSLCRFFSFSDCSAGRGSGRRGL